MNCVVLIVVYISPSGDKSSASETIAAAVRETERAKADAVVLIAGDFNGASLDTCLTSYTQYMNCNTCGYSYLDLAYCHIKEAYKAISLPARDQAGHQMIAMHR